MRGTKETAVAFYNTRGHNHDGQNSTKIDFSKYTPDELKVLADLLVDAQAGLGSSNNAADVIEGGSQVADNFIVPQVDAPSALTLSTDVIFDGHERTYIDVEWEAPPVQDFYYDEYYFDYYNPAGVFGANVTEYAVSLVKEGQPESDHRTVTKNTKIRFWDVDPETEYRVYVWALNSVGSESLYITDTIESNEIKRVYVGQKNRDIVETGGFESGITGWTTTDGTTSVTLSSSSTQAHSGTLSLRALFAGTGNATVISPAYNVVPLTTYDISAYLWRAGTFSTVMSVIWYDEFGSIISTDEISTVETYHSEWTKIPRGDRSDFYDFVTAPDLAVSAQVTFFIKSLAPSQVAYIDDFKFEQGTTIDGLKWSTDSDDQQPRIFVDSHTAIGAFTERSRIPSYIYFDEIRSVDDVDGFQQQATIYSGVPEDGPSATDGALGSFLIVRSTANDHDYEVRDRSDLVFRPGESDAHSLPRGLVSYGSRATDRTGIGSTEITLITGNSAFTFLKNRMYEFDFSCGRIFNSTGGDTFALRFKVAGTTRMSHTLSPSGPFNALGGRFGGAWSPNADVSGTPVLTMVRLTGSGTIAVEVGNNDMMLTVKDIGSSYITDGIKF